MSGITTIDGRLLPDIAKVIVDHYFKSRPFFKWLYGRKKTWKGGLEKRVNRITGSNGTTAAIDLTSTALAGPTTLDSKLSAAQYRVVGYRTPVSLTWNDILKSKGSDFAMVSETQNKMTQAYKEHFDKIADDVVVGDGTANAANGVINYATRDEIYGNVDPTVETDWQPNTVSASTNITGAMQVTRLITKTNDGGDRCDVGFVGDDGFVTLQSFAAQQGQLMKASGEADLGFDQVTINGVKFTLDHDWPDHNLTILTSKYFWMYVDDVFDFRFSGFVTPKGEVYLTGDIRTAFLLYAESRRRVTGYEDAQFI